MGRPVISCFRQNLDFSIRFADKSRFSPFPPLLRFLCLINSFYRKYVSCVYNISNISDIYSIYILSTLIYFQRASTSQMQVEWHMCKPRLKDENRNLLLSNSTSHWDLLYACSLYVSINHKMAIVMACFNCYGTDFNLSGGCFPIFFRHV